MTLRKCLLTGLLLIIVSSAWAQQPVFKQYTVAHGLPSSEVYYVMQDSKGFIWFATDHGVCRFDGTKFKTFTTADGLGDNTIFSITEDSRGRLWFRSFSGRLSWYENNSIFTIKNNDELQARLKGVQINSIYVSHNNQILVGMLDNRIYEFRLDSNNYCRYIRTIANCNVLDLDESQTGEAGIEAVSSKVLSTTAEITILVGLQKISIPVAEKMNNGDLLDLRCIKLQDNTYLISLANILIHLKNNKVRLYKQFKARIIHLYQSPDGAIWVGMYKAGITRFGVQEFSLGMQGESFFKEKSVTSCWFDQQGSSWFSTLESGVYFRPSEAYYYYPEFDKIEDKKVIGIGGRQLKTQKDGNEEIFAGLLNGTLLKQKQGMFVPFYDQAQCRKDGNVSSQSCFSAIDGTIWFAMSNNTLILRSDNTVIKERGSITAFSQGTKDNTIWASGYSEVCKFYNFKESGECYTPLSTLNIRTLVEIGGIIYLGTLNGLWSVTKNKFRYYYGKNNSLLSQRITGLQKDTKGRLWIATLGGGVLIKDGNDIKVINNKDGLLSDLCNAIYVDEEHTIWVCSNSGLSRISSSGTVPEKFTIDNYTFNSGLISNEVNQVYRQGNKVWVATNEGLSMIKLDKLPKSILPAPIYITAISNNNEDTTLLSNYHFSYNNNDISISYAGLSYISAGNITYRYLLKKDTDIPTIIKEDKYQYASKNTLQFTALAPGVYEFTIWAKSFNGPWSTSPAVLTFTITPPFWATWWFRTVCSVVLLVVLIVFYRLRIKRIVDRNQLLTELNKSRQTALSAQMEPHFIFNSLNSIQNYILHNNKLDANKYLSKFSSLMRLTLDNSKEMYVPLETELTALKLYVELEALRFKEKIEYKIYVDPEVDTKEYKVPALLIQPYVENAIWHGLMNKEDGIGKLEIELRKINTQLVCTVTDNGIGRKRSAEINKSEHLEKSSEGMALTQKRIELSNAVYMQNMSVTILDLIDEQHNPAGTRIEIVLPIIEE